MKNLEWLSSLAEISDGDQLKHPGLKYVKFVFCDDKPNMNKQGIKHENFAEIKRTAIGMPIKMKFFGTSAGGHIGSIPIGHITGMSEVETSDGTHQLVADGVLYADEYPDEIGYIEASYSEGKAPGISWELSYKDSLLEQGIEWLKGIMARAATFVRSPAYGHRTALLALASNGELSDEDFADRLTAIANELKPKGDPKGGKKSVDEKELQELKDKLAAAEAEVTGLKTEKESLTTENTGLKTQVTELEGKVTERDEKIQQFELAELIGKRVKALTEAGLTIEETDTEKLAKKFWAKMAEADFTEYVEEMKATKKAAASTSRFARASAPGLPRLSESDDDAPTTRELRSRLRGLSRSLPTEEE